MELEIFVIYVGVVFAIMDAPAFHSFLGGFRHDEAHRQAVLAFPAFGGVEDFVHDVSLPEADDLFSFGELLIFSGDADVSPHERAERVCDVGGIEPGAFGYLDGIFYLWMIEVENVIVFAFEDCLRGDFAEDHAFEQRVACEAVCAVEAR